MLQQILDNASYKEMSSVFNLINVLGPVSTRGDRSSQTNKPQGLEPEGIVIGASSAFSLHDVETESQGGDCFSPGRTARPRPAS